MRETLQTGWGVYVLAVKSCQSWIRQTNILKDQAFYWCVLMHANMHYLSENIRKHSLTSQDKTFQFPE